MAAPVITIIGRSGAGKTTLLEKLIVALTRRGYDVGTVKHHSHSGFEIDQPGKDSWRHARAGSRYVIVAAPDKIATYRLLERELELDEITACMEGLDIILVEGYRQANQPSLEVIRAANSLEMVSTPGQRFAVAADVPLDVDVPQFGLDDVQGIADLIEAKFLTPSVG
ncbi:MAG: molybdopterin-guanine dinucleotide biosynthesis protein B [Anaerolineae bacterium]|nr:molybdopterin-guanine dinucleotide biosynthesis protein B [Anaerolineae bacterium]